MRYIVGGLGWAPDHPTDPSKQYFPPGTIIDDSNDPYLASVGPPIDACPLDWPTYFYMISFEVAGKGYDYHWVSTRFLPSAGPFILGQSKLGEPDRVLGPGGQPVYMGPPPNQPPIVGDPVDYWGRPMPWLGL
jgi:hypothetical protein